MTVVIIVVVAAMLFAGTLLVVVRGGPGASGTLDDVGPHTRPVDLLAFRNLIDPDEEAFLRERLAPADFRRIERERLRAALEYVKRTAWNAAVLLRVGESLRHEQAVAGMGRDLASAALRLRMNALAALALLHVRLWMPGIAIALPQLARGYEDLRDHFARIARSQRPAQVTHLLASL